MGPAGHVAGHLPVVPVTVAPVQRSHVEREDSRFMPSTRKESEARERIRRDSIRQPNHRTLAVAGHPGEVMAVQAFTRITVDPNQMGGMPCIRGLRIPVATVVGMMAEGMTEQEILDAYPDLEREDIREALRFAAEAVRERELPLTPGR